MATLVKAKPKQKKKIEKSDKTKEDKIKIETSISKTHKETDFHDDLEEFLDDERLEIPELESSSIAIPEPTADFMENTRFTIDIRDQKESLEDINEKAKTENNPTEILEAEQNRRDSILKNLNVATNAFKDVSEAVKHIKQDISKLKLETVLTKSLKLKDVQEEASAVSYTFEEIANAFGVKEIIFARNYGIEFKQLELQPVPGKHILFEALMSYKLARNQLLENTKSIKDLQVQCQEKMECLWTITHHKATSKRESCPEQKKLSFEASFQRATLIESELSKYVNLALSLKDKATESYSTFSHNEHVLQIQIDDLLWRSSLNVETIVDNLRIVFWVILTTGHGTDTHYNKQLINWCLSLGSELLKKDQTLKSTLFLLHYLLSLNQNISWSYGLIQCKVFSISDIPAALSIFETILLSRRNMSHSTEAKTISLGKQDATAYDNTWLVVDFGEEVPDAEVMVADGSTLRESDLLGLIGQIPFDQIFKEMMLVKDNSYELVFCGASSSPELVMKIFCGARIAFSIIRHGLQLYDNYRVLSSELCKLTQHYVLYCTDLWEVTRSKWNISTIKRLSAEYDNLFRAGWSTIDCCAFKDIAIMFQSLLPFRLIPETTLFGMFEEVTKNFKAWTEDQNYHLMETLSNMAIARREHDFVLKVIKYLFSIGFTTENASKECGSIARTLCGTILKYHPQHTGEILIEMTNISKVSISPKGEWLEVLPLRPWRPTSEQLINILNAWNLSCQDMVSFLIQDLDWNCRSGLPLNVQRDVALFLAGLSQSFARQKLPIPPWIFDCLILLRIHAVDWGYALETAPEPESLAGLELSDLLLGSSVSTGTRCHASAMVVLASTTWGHSLPLLYEKGVQLLIRLGNAGRYREVVHLLYYAIAVLIQSPEDIKDSPGFKELLSTLLNSDRSYAQMATRFITGEVPGPIAKLLTDLIKSQTAHYQSFMLQSPAPILSVWLQWLMSLDGWSSDFSVLHLADTVISCCFNDGEAMGTAFTLVKKYIEDQTSSSSSGGLWTGNWFFGGGGPLKGLIQCPSAEVPLLWLVTMQAEHYVLEKKPKLWGRLLNKLSEQKEGKVNVDKALKSVGGRDGAAGLTLYKAAQYAVTTPVTHPYHTIMWQYFFSLYLDMSDLEYTQQSKPIGHLFFRGVVNSRLLSRMRSRLDDAKAHHDSQNKRYSKLAMEKTTNANTKECQSSETSDTGSSPDEYMQHAEFHKTQTIYMHNFKLWLDENALQSNIDGHVSSNSTDFMIAKLDSLMHGQYFPWYETVDNFDSRHHVLQPWPAVLLAARSNTPLEEPRPPAIVDDSSPADRILLRLKDAAKEKTKRELKNIHIPQPILPPTITPKEALALGKSALVIIKNFDNLYSNSESALVAEDNLLLRHIKQLHKENQVILTNMKYCTENSCAGVRLTLQYTESYLDLAVKEQINNNRIAFRASLNKLLVPFEELAKMTQVLIGVSQFPWALSRHKLSPNETSAFFMNVLEASSNMSCLPLRDSVSTAATKLGTAFVSSSGLQCCALLVKCGAKIGNGDGLAYERRAAIIGSMLRPLDLSTEEFIDVYKTIITNIPDTHITFSFLSKFDVALWLKNHSPSSDLVSEFLSLLVQKVAATGATPPADYMIVQELLCVHLSRTLQWSWPLHLPEVLKEMSQLACDDQLPPGTWEHIAKIIEANSHQIQLHCCTACGTVLGQSFQESRRRRMPRATWQGTAQSVHASSIARIGAGIGAAATAAAMLHQPTIMADRVAQLVFGILCSIFDPWLVPWWGESQSPAGGEPQMPWRPIDEKLVEIVFDAFVESMLYIVNTLPGSEVPLLRCVWSWYIWHYHRYNPHQHQQEWHTLPDYVIVLTHQQLARLPWHMYSWMSLHEMESIVTLSGRRHFNNLATHCMRGFRSECGSWDWISGDPHCLGLVLVCLVTLELDQVLVEDTVEYLPWWILNFEFLKEILGRFFSNLAESTEILCQHRLISLLCAASGLKSTKEAYALQKKLVLVQNWTIFLERKSSKSLENLGIDMSGLLERIEAGSRTIHYDAMDYISEGDLSTCKVLFDVAVSLLNVESLREHIIQEWIQFLGKCNKLSSIAIIGCISKITHKDIYSCTSEAAMDAYFRNGDDWDRLFSICDNRNHTNIKFLIMSGSLLTAFVTLASLQRDTKNLPVLLNKHILKSLKDTAPSCKNERGIVLWIRLILTLLSSDSLLNSFGQLTEAKAQLSAIIKQWSEEQGWGLLKAIGLGQNTAPSQKFRVVLIYSQSIKLFIITSKAEMKSQLMNTSSQLFKMVKSLEAMVNQKGCAEFKDGILECLQWLKTVESYEDWQNHLKALCKNLYPDYVNLYQYEL